LFSQGSCAAESLKNREILRRIMVAAEFKPVAGEWRHFNACLRDKAREKYPLTDR
jgi:D-alanyl-D-alanine dipeptidase